MEDKSTKNKINGAIISSRLAFVEKRWGSSAKQKLINPLPTKEKKLLESSVFENSWFEFATLESFDKTILEDLALGDKTVLHELGRFSAEFNFWRLPDSVTQQKPEELFKNTSRINVIFQNFGEVEIEPLPDKEGIKQVALLYRYQVPVSENYCASALGYFEKLLEQLGFSVTEVKETQCQSKGDPAHRYEVSWIAQQLAGKTITKEESYKSFKGTRELKLPPGAEGTIENLSSPKPNKPEISYTVIKGSHALAREETKFNFRIPILIGLILIVSLVGLVQWLFSSGTEVPSSSEKIQNYNCVGNLEVTIKVDKPYILVRSKEELTNLVTSFEDKGKKYSLKTKNLPANTLVELSLGEFLSSDNKAVEAELTPDVISLTAEVNILKQNVGDSKDIKNDKDNKEGKDSKNSNLNPSDNKNAKDAKPETTEVKGTKQDCVCKNAGEN
jgi:predicted hydrocarbon binding protein